MHPIIFTIGPLTFRYYGLMYIIALLMGIFLVRKEVRRKGMPLTTDDVWNLIIAVFLSGLVVARIYYVVFNWAYYSRFPSEIIAIWHGGLAIHGGIIGGLLGGIIMTRRLRVPFWRMADAIAPSLILGQAFGRFGNFMNGDAHGLPTDMPWGVVFSPETAAGQQFSDKPLHPTMLYELIFNVLIFSYLWRIRKRGYREGYIFALYLILYSVNRFFVSFFRADSLWIGGMRAAHLASIILIGLALFAIIKGRLWMRETKEGSA
jgi:phosphatidylglycerol:prolipoprotein diacylglycerol transferase